MRRNATHQTTMNAESQLEAIAFLTDARHYEGVSTVERCDTATAVVFLAGDRAYKLKRAVRDENRDYSTVDLRALACRAELELNRRTAPGVYLDAVPLTRCPDGHLTLGGDGPVVDWVMVMRRLPHETLLAWIAEHRQWPVADAAGLGDIVADFHFSAKVTTAHGGAAAIHRAIDRSASAFVAAGDKVDASAAMTAIAVLRDLAYRHAALLDQRRLNGCVRRCHGDLRLGKFVILDGVPTLIGALEFSDDLGCIDVWYDTAFLLMDLLAHHLPQHANAVFNRYLTRTGDIDGLTLLPLFLGCRAAMRAKARLAAADAAADPVRRDELCDEAARSLELVSECATPAPPRLIAIGGYSGAGKSTLAHRLAPGIGVAPGAVILSTDELRRRRLAVWNHLVPRWAYAADLRHSIYIQLRALVTRALATGYTVIADAVFSDFTERRDIQRVATTAGVPFKGLWLKADRAVLEQRLRAGLERGSNGGVAVLDQEMQRPLKHLRWTNIDAAGTVDQTLTAATSSLGHDQPAGVRAGAAVTDA